MNGATLFEDEGQPLEVEEVRDIAENKRFWEAAYQRHLRKRRIPEMNLSEENKLFNEYERAAKEITPRVAIMSIQHWREAGRPTASYWYVDQFIKPAGVNPASQGEPTIMSTPETGTGAPNATPTSTAPAAKEKKARPAGAKTLVRQVYANEPAGEYTVEELASKTGKPTSSITTAISDLRSTKYCKPGDPLVLHRHSNGKYSLTEEVKVEAPAAGSDATAQATQPADALPA